MQSSRASALRPGLALALTFSISLCCAAASSEPAAALQSRAPRQVLTELKLHVPSPDWRDQIIYFVMTDRFDDGEPGNNDQGAGEFDPASNAKYSGGDLPGITRRLDYIRGLGATALWLTPPVANQWWDGTIQYGGYHGYWAENFKAIDKHYGSLQDYQRLSHALHGAGMYLVQDIVVNHTGNFHAYSGAWHAAEPARNFVLNTASLPVSAPSQWPFSLNDARQPDARAAAIYHWTPDISDVSVPVQETTYQLGRLDDLNTENPVVRAALRDSYGYWIKTVGVDAFRVDTAFYVPPEFYDDFLNAEDAKQPGVLRVAQQTGREGFHVFGEGFGIDAPYTEVQARKIDTYMRAADGSPRMAGMLNFPLYGTIADVFARGQPTAELGHRIRSMMRIHQNPHLMPSFLDNHDVDRFLAGGDTAGLQQALLLLMTLPGIPTIYYGTEQGYKEPRAALFARGFGSGGRDRFDTQAPLYRYIQRATALRRAHPLFSRGTPTVLAENLSTPGAFAYRMNHGADSALVVFNTAGHEVLLDNLATGLPAGTVLQGLFGLDSAPQELVVGEGGRVSLRLPPRSGLVWAATARRAPVPASAAALTLQALAGALYRDDVTVSGRAQGLAQFKLVVDGDLAGAQTIDPGPDGRWQARIATAHMIDPNRAHRVVVWSETPAAVSAAQDFRVAREWKTLVEVSDPAGDDTGPQGRYRYPTDASWGLARPLDIRQLRVSGSGGALKLELKMQDLLATWNPPKGFDHVAFTLFLQLPGKAGGADLMPQQNARLPDGMRWHYRVRAHGWSNALFAAEGVSATHEGTSAHPGAEIRVDRAAKTVSLLLPAAALGGLDTLSGVKLYLTTWDYDGGYKPLTPAPQPHAFGGGDGGREPLIMDDTAVINLP